MDGLEIGSHKAAVCVNVGEPTTSRSKGFYGMD